MNDLAPNITYLNNHLPVTATVTQVDGETVVLDNGEQWERDRFLEHWTAFQPPGVNHPSRRVSGSTDSGSPSSASGCRRPRRRRGRGGWRG